MSYEENRKTVLLRMIAECDAAKSSMMEARSVAIDAIARVDAAERGYQHSVDCLTRVLKASIEREGSCRES